VRAGAREQESPGRRGALQPPDWRTWRGREEEEPQRPRRYSFRRHRSGAAEWAVVVLFMVLAVVVLLGAVAVLVVVLLLQPRAPYVAVRAASLYALVYGQTGALDDVQVTVRVGPATATRTRRPTSHASSVASRSPARRWRCFAPTRSACPPGASSDPAGVRGARAGRPDGRRRQCRHGGRAPRRRGAVPGGGGGPDAMEGRGDRQRRPVDAPGVPAPLLLAQRHRAPLQMQLQVQALVLLTVVPSVLSSGYSSDLSSMAGRERDGSRFRNSKWLHRFLSCLGFVQLLIHPHVACIGRQKKDFVLGSFLLHFTLPLKSKCHIRRFKTDH
jgi:hypothetical protein